MIVHNFHVGWAFIRPAEANPKLVVYSNAVLTLTLTLQRLQTIAGRRTQKLQSMCCIKLRQLPNRYISKARKPLTFSGFEQCLRIGTTEAIDHPFRL
jgi:hypothetical protein